MRLQTASILYLVERERERQLAKWGPQHRKPEIWVAILGEEYGEVCREVCEAKANHNNNIHNKPSEEYYQEMIQVAAVAVAACEDWKYGTA